jgi:flagellar hook-associated protein 1 FlgK
MGDDTASLSAAVDSFFAALNAVAGVDPTSTPLRQQVVTAAGLLAQRFNSLNNVYNAQLQSVTPAAQRDRRLGQHGDRAIAALNARITNANAVGSNASA